MQWAPTVPATTAFLSMYIQVRFMGFVWRASVHGAVGFETRVLYPVALIRYAVARSTFERQTFLMIHCPADHVDRRRLFFFLAQKKPCNQL